MKKSSSSDLFNMVLRPGPIERGKVGKWESDFPRHHKLVLSKRESGKVGSLTQNFKISFSVFFLSHTTFPFSSHFPKGKVTFAVGKSTFPCNVHTKNRTYIFQFFIFCSSSPLSHFPTFPLSPLDRTGPQELAGYPGF